MLFLYTEKVNMIIEWFLKKILDIIPGMVLTCQYRKN